MPEALICHAANLQESSLKRAPFAIFDVDTRQAKAAGGWTYMPRTLPYRGDVERLLAQVSRHQVPLVITTCVRGNMLEKSQFENLFDDTLFVPLEAKDTEWTTRCDQYRKFYIEKKFRREDFPNDKPYPPHEIFLYSINAHRLIDILNIDEWIVFGNAMEACGDLVISKLLEGGRRVIYIPELMVPGVKCANCDPVTFKNEVFAAWQARRAEAMSLEEVLKYMNARLQSSRLAPVA